MKPGYGPSILPSILKELIIRRTIVEKYGVAVDPKKKPKKGDGEKTASADNPNVNVPKDPDKGTEPFERKPDGGR